MPDWERLVIQTITIEREYGSGAGTIARKLADKLGWALWDEKITQEIARRLKCDVKSVEQHEEKPDSTFYRLMKIFMRGSYEERFSGSGTELLDAESLSHLFEKVITDVADRGPCIIVGRAAPWFLRERNDNMGVFIFAPYYEKMRRLTELGKSEEEAEESLEHVDADRAAFVKRYYGKEWPTRELYHLMINSVVGDQAVIDLILHEMEILNRSRV
jgi:cytidylate kinase